MGASRSITMIALIVLIVTAIGASASNSAAVPAPSPIPRHPFDRLAVASHESNMMQQPGRATYGTDASDKALRAPADAALAAHAAGRTREARMLYDLALLRARGVSSGHCAAIACAVGPDTAGVGAVREGSILHARDQYEHLLTNPEARDTMLKTIGRRDTARLRRYLAAQLERYRALAAQKPGSPCNDGDMFCLSPTYTPAQLAPVRSSIGRAVWVPPAPRVPGGALNANVDFAQFERAFLKARNQVVIVDNFLSKEALLAVRRFGEDATIWYSDKQYKTTPGGGYLGAYSGEGWNADVLLQIEEEVRQRFPRAIGPDMPLAHAWSYKYNRRGEGIDVHTDQSAVTLNLWLTPDAANRDPSGGGLVIYPVMPPRFWSFNTAEIARTNYSAFSAEELRVLDADAARVGETRAGLLHKTSVCISNYHCRAKVQQAFIAAVKPADIIRIPYKQNRLVMFNSNYLHQTDAFDFQPGYQNRRLNLALLFGNPRETPSDDGEPKEKTKCSTLVADGRDAADPAPQTCESCQKKGHGWCYTSEAGSTCNVGKCAPLIAGACECGPSNHWFHEDNPELSVLLGEYNLAVGCPEDHSSDEQIQDFEHRIERYLDSGSPSELQKIRRDLNQVQQDSEVTRLQQELTEARQELTSHLNVPPRAEAPVRTEMIVSAGKNATWMYGMYGRQVVLCSTTSKLCTKKHKRARDGQSLVHFILQWWDQLPHIRFALVHGSLNEWHHPRPFPEKLERAFQSDKPFVHLGLRHNYRTIQFEETGWCENAWRPYIGECPPKLCVAEGLEFVANGELFTWIPKHKWELLNKIGYGELAPEEFHLHKDPWLGIDYMFEWAIFILANQTACPPRATFWSAEGSGSTPWLASRKQNVSVVEIK